jgi:hypothetical protein
MKKRMKKLTLAKETLVKLIEPGQVQGGGVPNTDNVSVCLEHLCAAD